MRLTQQARNTIKWSGVTIAGYVRHYYRDGEWGGDECGCTDDRCIGYHHDVADECGCLDALIRDMKLEQARDRVAADIAFMRRIDRNPSFPTGLQSFTREQLEDLRDWFAAAVDEDDAMKARRGW